MRLLPALSRGAITTRHQQMKVLNVFSAFTLSIVGHLRTTVNGFTPTLIAFHSLQNSKFGFEQNVVTRDQELSIADNSLESDNTAPVVVVGGGK
jgi:hypothetical protein